MVENCGAAFGIAVPGLTFIASGVWVVLVGLSVKNRSPGGGLMSLGGAGNLWQRWTAGCVWDNLKIPIIGGYNNIWDWMVVVGGMLVVWELWKNRK